MKKAEYVFQNPTFSGMMIFNEPKTQAQNERIFQEILYPVKIHRVLTCELGMLSRRPNRVSELFCSIYQITMLFVLTKDHVLYNVICTIFYKRILNVTLHFTRISCLV